MSFRPFDIFYTTIRVDKTRVRIPFADRARAKNAAKTERFGRQFLFTFYAVWLVRKPNAFVSFVLNNNSIIRYGQYFMKSISCDAILV